MSNGGRGKADAKMMFDGDFESLQIRDAFDNGPLPTHPASSEFQGAAAAAGSADPWTWEGAALRWRLEAIRERSLRPGATLDPETLKAIALRVAERLRKAQVDDLNA